jgi:hypothetical protein
VQVTVLEVLTRALQEIRVLGADAQLDASDADLALRYFQGMVDQFQIDGFLTYALRRDDYILIPGQRTYRLGPAGPDWIGPAPTRVVTASTVPVGDTSATELFLEEYTTDRWSYISSKVLTADYPSVFHYQRADQTDDTGQFNFWPVPQTAATLILRAPYALQSPLTLTTVLYFFPGYYEAWMLNLARRLVRPFAANEAPTLAEAASRALGAVKRMNDPGPALQRSDPALLGGLGSGAGGSGILIARSASGPGGSPVWGQITGDISSQSDLQAALNQKVSITGHYTDPAWVTSLAASKITGSLTVAQGGIGLTTYTAGDLLVAADAAHLVALAAGPSGQVLTAMGAGAQPVWAPPAASAWGTIWGSISTQTDLMAQLALRAPLVSPAFTGIPTAPTAPPGTSSTQLATTAFVGVANAGITAGFAPINSPAFTGVPTAPTPASGNNSNQLATTAYVVSKNFATIPVAQSDVTGLIASLALKAPLASPALTGVPTAPTATPRTNNTQLATTAYCDDAIDTLARTGNILLSYTFVATITEPPIGNQLRFNAGYPYSAVTKVWIKDISTDGQDLHQLLMLIAPATRFVVQDKDDSTKWARFLTAADPVGKAGYVEFTVTWVSDSGGVLNPNQNVAVWFAWGTASGGGGGGTGDVTGPAGAVANRLAIFADTTGKLIADSGIAATQLALLNSPALVGTPTAPTATAGTNTTQLATTAFVQAATKILKHVITIALDGGGIAVTTGFKGFVSIPFACTIKSWRLLSSDAAATVGSLTLDIWKDTYANYPPTVADTITASAKPALASANKNESAVLTGWTTAIAAGDILGFNVDAASLVTKVTFELSVEE